MGKRAFVVMVALALVATAAGSVAGASDDRSTTCFGRLPTMLGTAAGEVITGTAGTDVIIAGAGDDEIYGMGGGDFICAGKGNDFVDGGGGKDKIRGDAGHDEIYGGPGNDGLKGNGGDDELYGEGGRKDILRGGKGDDILNGSPGTRDRSYGGPGYDRCFAGDRRWDCEAAIGTDALDPALPATVASPSLMSGFTPDPWTRRAVSGGIVDVSYLGQPEGSPEACAGFASEAPTFQVSWSGGGSLLRLFFLADELYGDTTMVVHTPSGDWACVDDWQPGRDPGMDITNPENGRYDVWIASYFFSDPQAGKFYVTELTSCGPWGGC